MPKVVRDFIRRTTDPNHGPLTYEEARQFYSNASSLLSAEEAHHLAPQAKHLLSQFTSVLGGAIKDTVDRAGRLQDLLDAMSEYRSAARLGAGVKRPRKPIALEKAPVDRRSLRCGPHISAMNTKRKGGKSEHRSIMLLESAACRLRFTLSRC